MADLRDYQPLLFKIYRELSARRTTPKYMQIRAAGCDAFDLRMKASKIEDMAFSSDMSVFRTAGEKKKTWKSASDVATDFSFLNKWESVFDRLLDSAKNTADPRPAFSENPKIEEPEKNLVQYDPHVAPMIPAVIFHRMFQLLSGIIERGYCVDFYTRWTHGASYWDRSPMQFAWADANGFCFMPRTCIEESASIYHPERPRLRRYVSEVSWKLNEIPDWTPFVDEFESVKNASLLAWSRRNFDRMILMPNAVASILHVLLSPAVSKTSDIWRSISPEFAFVDDPEDGLFSFKGLIGPDGKMVSKRDILKNGTIQNANSMHPMTAPIFRATANASHIDMSVRGISSGSSERILFVEQVDLRILGGDLFVYYPAGGVLYRDGRCRGHVVAPAQAMPLPALLANAKPFGCPVRIGGLACCAMEISA